MKYQYPKTQYTEDNYDFPKEKSVTGVANPLNQSLVALADAMFDIKKTVEDQQRALSLQIHDLNNAKLELTHPMSVIIERENKIFYASSVDIDAFGEGSSEMDALISLKEVVVNYYFSLKESEKDLSPLLKSKLKVLRKLINEI